MRFRQKNKKFTLKNSKFNAEQTCYAKYHDRSKHFDARTMPLKTIQACESLFFQGNCKIFGKVEKKKMKEIFSTQKKTKKLRKNWKKNKRKPKKPPKTTKVESKHLRNLENISILIDQCGNK